MNVSELGHGAHPNDPTLAAKPDGCTVVEYKDYFLVYGGWAADRIWRLNIPSASWTEVVTHGTVPHARIHHAAAVYNGFMLVTGGELVEARPGTRTAHLLSYYELDLDTYEWIAVETFGAVPTNRSHHTSDVVNDVLVVLGGKPADGRLLTNGTMAEAKRTGFYDVYILHVLSRTWRRVEMYDPRSPMLWGHSASVFRGAFIICFGGFDVGASELAGAAPFAHNNELIETPPEAVLSDVVHILDMGAMTWKRCTAGTDLPPAAKKYDAGGPIARSDHVAMIVGLDLFVFGGFAVDRCGRGVNVNDFWRWDIETGEWTKLEFCVPAFNSRRLIAGAYGDHVVVVPRMQHLFFLNTARRGSGWQKVPCSVESRPLNDERIRGAAEIGEDDDRDESPTRRAMRQRPPHTPDEALHQVPATRSFRNLRTPSPETSRQQNVRMAAAAGPSTPAREYGEEVDRLRREVEYLRARVGNGASRGSSPVREGGAPPTSLVAKPRVPTSATSPGAPESSRKMHRWFHDGGRTGPQSPARRQSPRLPTARRQSPGPSARDDKPDWVAPAPAVSPRPERPAPSYERIDLPARRSYDESRPEPSSDDDGSRDDHRRDARGYPPPPRRDGPTQLGPHHRDSPLRDASPADRVASASPIRLHASLAGARTLQRQREALRRTRREQLAKLRQRLEDLRADPSNSAVDQALIDSLEDEARKVALAIARADSPSRSSSPVVDGHMPSTNVPLPGSRAVYDAGHQPAHSATPGRVTLMQRARLEKIENAAAQRVPSDHTQPPRDVDPAGRATAASPPAESVSFTRRHASPHATVAAARTEAPFPPTVSIGMPRPADRNGFVIARAPSTALAPEIAAHRAAQQAAVRDPTPAVGGDDSRPLTPVGDYWDELDRALDAPAPTQRARAPRPRPEWQL